MSRILITGASGFIGRALARKLCKQGHQVRCLVRRSSKWTDELESHGATLCLGEINDSDAVAAAVENCELVFHSAGVRCVLQTSDFYRVNGAGCRILGEACVQQPEPPLVVLISSVSAAGPAPLGQKRSEQEIEAPVSDYGKSKLAGEQELKAFADRMPISIVRPGIVIGPENEELFPLFRTIRRWRNHLSPAGYSPRVSLIHVDDLIELLQIVADRGERAACAQTGADSDNGSQSRSAKCGAGIYFASDEHCPDYEELGAIIAKALDRDPVRQIRVPLTAVKIAAALSSAVQQVVRRPDVFNLDKIRDATAPSWACTTEKVKRELGFEPAQTLQQRIDETAAWYVQQRWLK